MISVTSVFIFCTIAHLKSYNVLFMKLSLFIRSLTFVDTLFTIMHACIEFFKLSFIYLFNNLELVSTRDGKLNIEFESIVIDAE